MEQETRIMEPIPAEDEIKITATPWLEEVSDDRRGDSLEWPAAESSATSSTASGSTPPACATSSRSQDADWEVSHELEYEHYGGDAA